MVSAHLIKGIAGANVTADFMNKFLVDPNPIIHNLFTM